MPKEYIEREAAISFPFANGQYDREHADEHFINGCESYREWLEQLPAADVVEVVRCRDCVFWEPASPTRTSGNCNRSFDIPAWATDFCSYGKRKDGGPDE